MFKHFLRLQETAIADGADGGGSGDPVTTPLDGGAWYETLAGDNTDRVEALKGFETPDAFLQDYDALKNRNWRDELAGEDTSLKSQLERFKTPGDFAKSYSEAQQKIRSGAAKQPLGADATEDDVKAYREANGIPLEAKGYLENLPDGLVLGEDDQPIFESFMARLHAKNAPPELAHEAVAWYNDFQEEQAEALLAADQDHKTATDDKLRQEWGPDYRPNINLISSFLDKTFGEETRDLLVNARLKDGSGLMNNPEVLEGLMTAARQLNPVGAIVGPTQDAQQTLTDEIAKIEKVMREDNAAYVRDSAMQDRLLQLYDLQSKHSERTG